MCLHIHTDMLVYRHMYFRMIHLWHVECLKTHSLYTHAKLHIALVLYTCVQVHTHAHIHTRLCVHTEYSCGRWMLQNMHSQCTHKHTLSTTVHSLVLRFLIQRFWLLWLSGVARQLLLCSLASLTFHTSVWLQLPLNNLNKPHSYVFYARILVLWKGRDQPDHLHQKHLTAWDIGCSSIDTSMSITRISVYD